MTIDESIAREKELAEIYRNDIVPKEDYHNMPWIDMENELNMRRAKEHEQLAEWLEELKAIKDGSIPIIHGKAELELHDKEIYNKALDEFIYTIKPRMEWDNQFYALAIEHCIKIAEQLKEQ